MNNDWSLNRRPGCHMNLKCKIRNLKNDVKFSENHKILEEDQKKYVIGTYMLRSLTCKKHHLNNLETQHGQTLALDNTDIHYLYHVKNKISKNLST